MMAFTPGHTPGYPLAGVSMISSHGEPGTRLRVREAHTAYGG
jgi:hypothetical protein